MRTISRLPILIKRSFLCVALCLFFTSPVHAVVINFDDLVRHEDPSFDAHPLTDEYLAQGLLIDTGYLAEYWEGQDAELVSSPNYLLGGDLLKLIFVDVLPTFVSMYVSSPREDRVSLFAYTQSGNEYLQQTTGWAGSEDDPPYEPRQYIEFNVSEGISEIWVGSYYSRNTSAMIDDLTFTAVAVPEPSMLSLLLMSLGIIIFRQRHFFSRVSLSF